MRYPSPDTRTRVRGPVQEITKEDGSVERRRLYILTSRHGRHTTKVPQGVSRYGDGVPE